MKIKRSYDALQRARIEFFIHGALCVSYSGQCYASFAATGRSANRGACAQLCRLPYSVYTEDGRELITDRHVLSLKDNNQTENLEALIDAGVRSFKIEGRLKDADYVKNITAHYRAKIDEILARRPEFTRSSDGISRVSFTPNPQKSFNRGFTDYFTCGRHHDMAVFETPKNTGERIGKIVSITPDALIVASTDPLHNADGLTYLTREKTLMGFAVNRAEELEPGRWRLTLRDRPIFKKHPQLAPGVILYRNRDQEWDEALSKPTARRVIAVQALWQATDDGFSLTLSDAKGNEGKAFAKPESLQKAADTQRNRANIEKNIRKTGETDYEVTDIEIRGEEFFAPASFVNQMRRVALAALEANRKAHFKRLPQEKIDEKLPYPDPTDYRANVLNAAALDFYARHSAPITEPALETGSVTRDVPLMLTKHCVRYALGLCLKDNIEMAIDKNFIMLAMSSFGPLLSNYQLWGKKDSVKIYMDKYGKYVDEIPAGSPTALEIMATRASIYNWMGEYQKSLDILLGNPQLLSQISYEAYNRLLYHNYEGLGDYKKAFEKLLAEACASEPMKEEGSLSSSSASRTLVAPGILADRFLRMARRGTEGAVL